ncbi:MAG: tandem-95 repeat protein [Rhizobacter sp.]|nr:tandem-95 repeat protein [Ferruginibacter sp.]
MQKQWRSLLAVVFMVSSYLFVNTAKAQQSLTQINGWNAYVHLPAGYATSGLRYPTIIFAPGIGEVGNNAGAVISNGPGAYISQGWNGNVTIDGSTVEFIVISIQPLNAFPTEATYNARIQTIKNLYRVDPQRLYLTGLSHGGWMSSTFVTGDAYGGPYNYASQIAAVCTVQGMIPDDNSPYPNLFDNYALAGGRYLGFEQTNDGRDTRRVVDRMNAAKPNSAVYVQTSFGNGGHCCWNQFYGGQGVNPGVFNLGGINQNLYQWLARQTLASATNIPPVANAGPDLNITLPASTAALNGSATDADGTVLTYLWNQVAGPGAALIANNAAGVTSVSNLIQGQYKFVLTVMDNMGSYGRDTMQLTVNNDPSTQGCNSNAPVTHYLTRTNTGTGVLEIYRPNGSAWKGGDTVKITGNYYSVIELYNIAGDPCRPIVIMPQTTLTTPVFRIKGNSRYVKIWGGPTQYGIKITPGAIAVNLSHHIEVNNVECSGGSVGVYAKQDVVYSDPMTWHPNYRMSNLVFKNMWVHDIQGEGMYIGITQPDGLTVTSTYSGLDTTILPIRLDSVEVSNCIVERTDWDGIQLSNARNGNKIINNTVRNYGRINMSAQQAGIILGGNCSGDISGNTILRGTGSGIQVFGYGVINISNNVLDSCGYNGQSNPNGSFGLQTIYANDYIINSESNPKQTINAFGNAVNHPLTGGGIFITDYLNNSFPSSVYNNTFCIPGAGANWQSIYIKAYVPGSIVTNNTLSCSTVPNMAPVANAGGDISITLPANSTTLTGFGTDVDGTIVAHSWVKIAGPSAGTLTNATAASATASGLVQGTYRYQLTVTDNLGAIGRDTVQVTVNPIVNVAPVANAGLDVNITLPTNTVTFNGTGTDADGTIASFAWTKISGPAAGSLTNIAAANAVATGLQEGIYQYQLTVTDDDGATGKDTVQVTVTVAPNSLPVVNAGADITITLPLNTTDLSGTATDPDGTIASYQWQKISGPVAGTLANITTAVALASALEQGVYQFSLTATDNAGAVASDTVNVTVNPTPNLAPAADAGADVVITLPENTVTFSGSGTDPDGTIVSYVWAKVSGPAGGSLTNAATATATANGLNPGVYLYRLIVTDNAGATGSDTLQVTVNGIGVNQAPTANAGTDAVITLPQNTAALTGTGTDADGTIVSFNWVEISGPSTGTLTNQTAATATAASLLQGVYQYELTVTDNSGATGKDTVQVTVNPANNIAPVANAGNNISITLPANTATLNGSGIDTDGSIVSYAWLKISGPATGNIATPNAATATLSLLVQGVYQYQLTVTDNAGAIGRDTIQVTVNAAPNLAPVANAGANISITLPTNSTSLNGSGTDTDGTIAAYLWTKIAGPAAGSLSNATNAVATASGLVQGTYQYRLRVTDNAGATASDTIQVTVNAAPNVPPVASAGTNITIILPTNTAPLNGSGTDTDGTISSYAWLKISGPAAGTITNANSAAATATGVAVGVYHYQLTVTDNNGAIGRDTVQLTVNPAPNVAPTASAGNDIAITLPMNSATLSGSGTDADGSIASYAWVKISGPVAGAISNTAAQSPVVSGLTQGIYRYQLTVTDNAGATGRDTMQLTVNPAVNIAPAANAGINLTITLPVNSAILEGSGTDADGNIVSYAWIKISGPAPGAITNPTAAVATATGLAQGIYRYQLTVTDNSGAIGRDTMQVTVNPAVNIPPVANAGNNITLTLPNNSTLLSGSGTDTDGTITGYLWTKIAGPATGNLANTTSAVANVSALVQGVYQYRLRVTDNSGATAADTVQVTVNPVGNILPVANAGTDINITLPQNTSSLNGSGTDGDGTIVAYAWVKISGPAAGTITNANAAIASVAGVVLGVYQYQLTVTDNSGGIDRDTVRLIVNPASNIAPVANAGNDITITLPANTAVLSGSGTDTDGSIASYVWIKIAGPASGTLTNATTATPTANGLVQGIYQYQLTVTDNEGATGRDTVRVTLNPVVNIRPVANAGNDIVITLPVNTATLNGSGTDTDGTIVSYAWIKIAGPASGTIVNAGSPAATLNNLAQGVYRYQLTVTDNGAAIGRDTIQVTVNEAANIPPVADAGINISITLPPNNTTISGSGTDIDGSIVSYLWEKVDGPAGGILATPNAAVCNVTDLVFGVYQYRLTVTDDDGAMATDTMTVTVGEGRKDKDELLLSVYPNPVITAVNAHIITNVTSGNASITLYDNKGGQLFTKKVALTGAGIIQTISMVNYPRGTYHIKVSINGNLYTTKTVVKGG